MSIELLLKLWKTKLPITPSQRLVLHCLAHYVNDKNQGLCCPSYHSIADITGLSRRGVIKIIDQLCFTGLLTKELYNRKANHYRITLPGSEPSSLGSELGSPHGEPSSPNSIIYNINDIKEYIVEKKLSTGSEDSAPAQPSLSSLRSTAKDVLSFLRKKTGRRYSDVDSNLKPIIYLLKEGITREQCKQVIARKHREWSHDPKFEKYLRPSTLFNKTNFHSKYLPECVSEIEKKEIMQKG